MSDYEFIDHSYDVVVIGGGPTGVELADGEFIPAARVISNLDPKTTLLDLLGPQHLEADFVQRVRHVRSAGSVMAVGAEVKQVLPVLCPRGTKLG